MKLLGSILVLSTTLFQANFAFSIESDDVDDDTAAVKSKIRGAASKLKTTTTTSKESKESSSSSTGSKTTAATTTSITPKALSWIVQSFFDDDSNSIGTSISKTPASTSMTLRDAIRNATQGDEMQNFMQTMRRSMHRHPELMYDLPFTNSIIQTALTELGIPFTSGWAKNSHPDVYDGPGGYGIVGHVGSMDPNQPCIILRADIDALPILEAAKYVDEFKSAQRGKMHACGHDAHGTMLLGAAAVLKQIEWTVSKLGTIRLVFQPAEEGGAGMKRMVEEGVVELQPKAIYAFGMHVCEL